MFSDYCVGLATDLHSGLQISARQLHKTEGKTTMKKVQSILINSCNTPIILEFKGNKPITADPKQYNAKFVVYPVYVQGHVAGTVKVANNTTDAWDIAYAMSESNKDCGIDFADNFDLARD